MSEDTSTQDLTVETEQDDDLVKNLRAQLRKERDGRIAAEQGLAEKSKSEAFRDIGIDISKGPGKLLFQHYDGDLTPEAVQAVAEEYGITAQSATEEDDQPDAPTGKAPVDHPDRDQHKALEEDRGTGGNDQALNAAEAAQAEYEAAINAGRPNEDAMAASFEKRMETILKAQR